MKILLVSRDKRFSRDFIEGLIQEKNNEVLLSLSGDDGLDIAGKVKPDLVVADEKLSDMSGIEFVENLVKVDPFINSAIVSSLNESDFHEATEGLGVLMALPVNADIESASLLLDYLRKINGVE